jgi:hypothetical protein
MLQPSKCSELQVQNDILNAVILDSKGNVFASYTKPGSDATYKFSVPTLDENTSYFTRQNLLFTTK